MNIFNSTINNLIFKDTIFLKDTSSLQNKYEALKRLSEEYPDNSSIQEEMYIIKKGLDGEEEIKYQLSKANIGLYVLRDINIEFEDLKAQIDYIIVTKFCCYFIECKNLLGNITITDKGDFIREYTINNQKIKKGMYSPLRQVEAQRDVYKKIWNNHLSSNSVINSIKRLISESSFPNIHRVLVVAANNETILNTKYAPDDIKNKIIKSDFLIRRIQYDINNSNKCDWSSKNRTEKWAKYFLSINKNEDIDYYEYYKNKFLNNMSKQLSEEEFKLELIEFRRKRSSEMNIPAYYVFTNEELDKIVQLKPKTIDELKSSNILNSIKLTTHGQPIVDKIKEIIDNKG